MIILVDRAPERIEEVGDLNVDRQFAGHPPPVGDRGSQVRTVARAATQQHHPAIRVVREIESGSIGLFAQGLVAWRSKIEQIERLERHLLDHGQADHIHAQVFERPALLQEVDGRDRVGVRLRERRVAQARTQAVVQLAQRPVRRHDGRQASVVAMVDELEQLLLGPRRRALRTQVVKDEHRRGAHLLEELVIAHRGVRPVGGAQMVEQVRHDDEQRRRPQLQAAIGDGGGDVRLAAAGRADEHEPALRVFCERLRVLHAALEVRLVARVRAASAGDQIIERQARKGTDVAVALEPVRPLLVVLAVGAAALYRLAEVRILDRQVEADEARAAALLANVRVQFDRRRLNLLREFRWNAGLLQQFAQARHLLSSPTHKRALAAA